MKALQGNQGRPELIECDVPRCEAGQVRIRVVAAGKQQVYTRHHLVSVIFLVWSVQASSAKSVKVVAGKWAIASASYWLVAVWRKKSAWMRVMCCRCRRA